MTDYHCLRRESRFRIVIVALVTLAAFAAVIRAQSPQPGTTRSNELELMVPMRDGVKLATTVYQPEGDGPWPMVLIRTPYGRTTQSIGNDKWTGRGFAMVVQDCRGTGQSEGENRPFMSDHLDGFDSVEWLAKQP